MSPVIGVDVRAHALRNQMAKREAKHLGHRSGGGGVIWFRFHFSDYPTNQDLSDLFARFVSKTEVSISSDATPEESYLPHDSRHSTGHKLRPNVRLDCEPNR